MCCIEVPLLSWQKRDLTVDLAMLASGKYTFKLCFGCKSKCLWFLAGSFNHESDSLVDPKNGFIGAASSSQLWVAWVYRPYILRIPQENLTNRAWVLAALSLGQIGNWK